MTTVVLIAIIATALGLGLLSWVLLAGENPQRALVRSNLQRSVSRVVTETESKSSAIDAWAQKTVPASQQRGLAAKLAKAGRPPNWPIERVVAMKFVLTLVGLALGALVYLTMSGWWKWGALVIPVVLHFFPEIRLDSMAQDRMKAVGRALPDTMDQMSIAVQAGLGFDAAMIRVARNGTGPLAQELMRTLQDIQVGQTRRAAYEDLMERTPDPDLRRFMRTVVQAETYGLALGDVLRTQADEMRVKRRQRAEERAMKIPVLVILPLMLFILPVIFIMVLGPAVVNIMGSGL